MKYRVILCIIIILLILFVITHQQEKTFTNAQLHIPTYQSKMDKDSDGIDDQTDILNNVKEYIKTKPKYKSKYYENGYPTDEYGVCTDVVAFGLLNAGYDLKQLVNEDIKQHKNNYSIDVIDINIDFRRVKNLYVYLKNNANSLTLDTSQIKK